MNKKKWNKPGPLLTEALPDAAPWEAFIGNGYIGQRIGIDGTGSWDDPRLRRPGFWDDRPFPSGSVMNGLWGETGLEYLPRWCSMKIGVGRESFGIGFLSPFSGRFRDYRQELNLYAGLVETSGIWEVDGADGKKFALRFKTTAFLSRTQRNTGVIETVLVPDFEGWITAEEEFDGSFCRSPETKWEKVEDRIMRMKCFLGDRRREVDIWSRMGPVDRELPELMPHPFVEIPSVDFRSGDRSLKRMIYLNAQPGETIKLRKIAGIYSDQDGSDERGRAGALIDRIWSGYEEHLRDHRAAWEKLWSSRIEIDNPLLQKIADSTLYMFYSQLEEERSYALGPLGITGGECWRGRLFWDGDLWMFPGLNLLNPALAKGFVDIRTSAIKGAFSNAAAEGRSGVRFAWESTETGEEKCTGHEMNQIHLNSAICLAQERYHLASGDEEFWCNHTLPLLEAVVEYWLERIWYNEVYDRYEISRVSCPDEFSGIVDNNVLTNFAAVKDIRRLVRIYEESGKDVPELWREIPAKMFYPRNEEGVLLEYEGYGGQTIKQADTTLLVFPYEMDFTPEESRNILDYYSDKTEKGGIMMSGVIDGIGYGRLGDQVKLQEAVERCLPHFHGPFLTATETPLNNNQWFMTGLGGFLQLLLFGMAGLRQSEEGLDCVPCLPDGVNHMSIRGLHHRGKVRDLEILRTETGFSYRFFEGGCESTSLEYIS